MPIAVGECHVDGVATAYVANLVSGLVTVINVDQQEIITNIPVTLTPDGQSGLNLLHSLQGPIQTPVSPDEKWVATAVFSLTTVDRPHGAADHVAIINTHTNQVVAYVPTPAGTHGVNWGAKLGGGYYAYVTNQHSNVLTVIDPDPNSDNDGTDATVVGTILLSNQSSGAGVTDGTGGQGVKPLPMTHDGWIQKTVALVGSGELSEEVENWVSQLTDEQKNPETHQATKIHAESFTIIRGFAVSGQLSDTFQSDDSYFSFHPGIVLNAVEPPVWLGFESALPQDNPATFVFTLEAKANTVGLTQTIEFFNYDTGSFELVHSSVATQNDSVIDFQPDGDILRFVDDGTGSINVRLGWKSQGPVFLFPWTVSIDQIEWTVTE